MKRNLARGGWFAIVATDLFASLFAAVIIIDAVTPKMDSPPVGPAVFTMTYEAKRGECTDHSIVFVFEDSSGDTISTIDDGEIGALLDLDTCTVAGSLSNVAGTDAPSNPRLIVGSYPSRIGSAKATVTIPQLSAFSAEVTD